MEDSTEILYGNDEITKRTIEVFNSTEKTIEGCIGKDEIRTHVTHDWHMKGLSELRRRGVKVRVVTQVTQANLPFCKIYSQAVELRHIDGIQSSFGISDGKWLLDHIVSLDEFPLSHAILTNATKLVQVKLQLFETVWKQSISALEAFKRLEESIQPEIRSKLSSRETERMLSKLITNSKYRVDLLIPSEDSLELLAKRQLRSHLETALNQGVKIRILLPKNENSFPFLKDLNDINFELREVNDIRSNKIVLIADNQSSLSFEINQSDNGVLKTSLRNGIYSTSSVALMTFSVLFEKMWN
jgi:phosphatidylserine/phosphatidylglycerophosphate/cardiolipin synthase-like enzyme